MPALYNFPFAKVMNIQNKWGNNLWAVWALCGVSLSLRSAGCILPEASQRRQEHTNRYVFLSLHTWEQDNLRKLHLRQKSLWNEMHIFTVIYSHAWEVLCLRSKAFSDSWQHLSWCHSTQFASRWLFFLVVNCFTIAHMVQQVQQHPQLPQLSPLDRIASFSACFLSYSLKQHELRSQELMQVEETHPYFIIRKAVHRWTL